MALPVDPTLALGTLRTLARHQGTKVDPVTEEQPGRILHEVRLGLEPWMAGSPSGAYYGTVDATPLFVMLLGELRRWGIERAEVDRLLPHADRALAWIEQFGDRDGDGFVEYERSSSGGLYHQGWKDSFDGINFADGRLAEAPIALCEVQGYVYSAYLARGSSPRRRATGPASSAGGDRAARLREAFNERFWLADRGWFAVGLDRDKRPIDALASNMGHCLWTGIVDPDKAAAVADRLLAPEMFSGWGIRTLATTMGAYNPVSYHNGSVWPHDNAIAAGGLMRYGFVEHAQRVALAILDTAAAYDGRLPELLCGFDRTEFPGPCPTPRRARPRPGPRPHPSTCCASCCGVTPGSPAGCCGSIPPFPPRSAGSASTTYRWPGPGCRSRSTTARCSWSACRPGSTSSTAAAIPSPGCSPSRSPPPSGVSGFTSPGSREPYAATGRTEAEGRTQVDRTPLRIAVVAPPWFEVPPGGYGGIEVLCADLVDALVERGHDVLLVGAGDHGTKGRFAATGPTADATRVGQGMPEMLHAAAVATIIEEADVDVVHDHTAAGPLLAFGRPEPTIVTAHGPVQGELGEYYRRLAPGVHLVAISDAQRAAAPDLPWAGTVPNAVDVSRHKFAAVKDDYVLFLGRVSPEKAPDLAIQAARDAGRHVVASVKCREPEEQRYFEEHVEPLLGSDVTWVHDPPQDEKLDLLARARCLLFPIQWEEPFGLVMIEAMASGTPVVALRRGAVPEVVVHGVTGFICDDPSEFPAAIEAAGDLDPVVCRDHVSTRFSPARMARGYERHYRRAIARAGRLDAGSSEVPDVVRLPTRPA